MIDLGEVAYNAYGDARGWVVVGGGPMPRWDEQSPELRDAWDAAAQAVVNAIDTGPTSPAVRNDARSGSAEHSDPQSVPQ